MMKPSLILIPGLGANNDLLWRHQIEHLSALLDCRAVIADQDSLDGMVTSVLNSELPKFSLAGHSLGGWVAQAVAAKAPERIEKLILMDTWTREKPDGSERLKLMAERIQNGELEKMAEEHRELILHPLSRQNPKIVSTLQRIQASMPKQGYLNQLHAMLKDPDITQLARAVAAPTLVIRGADDPLFDFDDTLFIKQTIAHAKMTVVEQSGHVTPLEQPQAITALLRLWLTS